jgi:hypothetical protein
MSKVNLQCPACGDKLKTSALMCQQCGIEVRGQFDMQASPFDVLSTQQEDFILSFLKNRGNMKQLQEELKISYPAAKKKLDEVLCELGLFTNQKEDYKSDDIIDVMSWEVEENSMKASDIIKRKLKENGGRAIVTSYRGNEYEIWATSDGQHFTSDSIIQYPYDFKIFDIIVDFLKENGGKAKKGSAHTPLGTKSCTPDTVAGAILQNYFGLSIGESGPDPGFFFAAILAWAGIAKNTRGWLILC